jgi:hypothetical protein
VKRKLYCILSLYILSYHPAPSQTDYRVGMYVSSLYGFDYVRQNFMADLWIWSRYGGDIIPFDQLLDVSNAESLQVVAHSESKKGRQNWVQDKLQATVHCDWKMESYPFDSNHLRFVIEGIADSNEVRLIPDAKATVIEPERLESFVVEDQSVSGGDAIYETTYGNPDDLSGKSSYSRIVYDFRVTRRNPWILFFKLTAFVYVAFIIALLPFLMKSEKESRLAFPSASLFAVVSNKYIVDGNVPSANSITLMDCVHIITLFMMLLIFIALIRIDNLEQKEVRRGFVLARGYERRCLFVIALMYCLMNFALVFFFRLPGGRAAAG